MLAFLHILTRITGNSNYSFLNQAICVLFVQLFWLLEQWQNRLEKDGKRFNANKSTKFILTYMDRLSQARGQKCCSFKYHQLCLYVCSIFSFYLFMRNFVILYFSIMIHTWEKKATWIGQLENIYLHWIARFQVNVAKNLWINAHNSFSARIFPTQAS